MQSSDTSVPQTVMSKQRRSAVWYLWRKQPTEADPHRADTRLLKSHLSTISYTCPSHVLWKSSWPSRYQPRPYRKVDRCPALPDRPHLKQSRPCSTYANKDLFQGNWFRTYQLVWVHGLLHNLWPPEKKNGLAPLIAGYLSSRLHSTLFSLIPLLTSALDLQSPLSLSLHAFITATSTHQTYLH